MIERRTLDRMDVDKLAYISGDGASLRCRVVNMSDRGAAIELPSKRHINPKFKLMLDKDRIIRSCRLVWSSDNRIGVEFEEPLRQPGPPCARPPPQIVPASFSTTPQHESGPLQGP